MNIVHNLTDPDAMEKRKTAALDILREKDPKKRPKGAPVTLGTMIDRYVNKAGGNKTPHTLENERSILKRFCGEIGREVPLHDVTPEMMDGFKGSLSEKLAASTVIRNLNVVRAFFEKMIDWEYLEVSPMRRIKNPKLPEQLPKYYTADEIKRFFEKVPPYPTYWRSFFLLYFYTGMRRSELTELKWSDIRDGMIHIVKPKERREKVIPLNEEIEKVLAAIPRFGEKVVDYCPNHIGNTFVKIAKEAGIKDPKLHRLRHSFGTHALAAGEDLKMVSELLGHADTRVTERYAWALAENKKKAMGRLNLSAIVSSRPNDT